MPPRLGRYHLIHKIGEGGLSNVYLGVKDQQPYAVKCLKAERVHEPQAVADFIREVRIGSKLRHPNILPILDQGRINDTYFLVMELLLGGSVQQLIDDYQQAGQKVPLPLSLYLIRDCCQALRYLHRTSIFENSNSVLFHGDLSSDNVMIAQDGTIRIVDFGSAGQESFADATHRHFGKLAFLPPEVFKGAAPSTGTDIYSLGVLAFYLFFGQRPFEGTSKIDLTRAIEEGSIPRLPCKDLVRSSNDENVLRIFFNRALGKELEMRFKTVDEFERHLFHVHFSQQPLTELTEVTGYFHERFTNRLRVLDAEWTAKLNEFRTSDKADRAAANASSNLESLLAQADRRKHPRISTETAAIQTDLIDTVQRAKVQFEVRELSCGGMLVKWEGLVPRRGQEYPVVVHLGAGYAQVRGVGRLLYEVSKDKKTFAALRFTEIPQSGIAALNHYIQNHLQDHDPSEQQERNEPDLVVLDVFFMTADALRVEFERNMKHGGMFIESERFVETGETVFVRIHLPHTFQRILLKGKVVVCQPVDQRKHSVSLHLEMKPEQLETLVSQFSGPS
ncbi:MAG TPA: protein kinase [Bdellovibrionota bacterium]|nr:protein kinase [Bdellovibrionota bacterium]